MIERSFVRHQAQISFTSDFHELVRGDLKPGASVLLRYDPRRMVKSPGDYLFGDPRHQFFAHVPSDVVGQTILVPLVSYVGILESPDYDETGNGSMLMGDFAVPGDTTSLSVWFTHRGPDGTEATDSDYERRFVFPFAKEQVGDIEGAVRAAAIGDEFTLRLRTSPDVRRVSVRFRTVTRPFTETVNVELQSRKDGGADGSVTWDLDPQRVPSDAVVSYKVYYWIDDRRLKDDNDGEYYRAIKGVPELVPAPPPDLAAAAAKWV